MVDDDLRGRVVEAYVRRLGVKMRGDDVLYRTLMAEVARTMLEKLTAVSTGVGALQADVAWVSE